MRAETPTLTEKRKPGRWATGLLFLVAMAVYGNSYPGAWVFDDAFTIPGNPDIGRLWPPRHAFAAPPGSPAAGRPLVALSFHLNTLVGLRPAAFRFVNVLIHATNAVLLFFLLRRLLGRLPRWRGQAALAAWASALLWAVHPLNTSAVTYISQRAESLMACFFLAAMLCLARLGEAGTSVRWAMGAVAATFAATLCKEVGAMLPLLVVPFERAYFGGRWREAWEKRKSLALACALPSWVFLAFTLATDPRHGTVRLSYQGINPWTYLCTQAVAVTHYLRKLLWPDELILDYGWPIARDWQDWLPPALFLSVLLLGGLALMLRRPALGFPIVFFFVVLAPSSSVLPILTEIMAEHRMYLPAMALIPFPVLGALALFPRSPRRVLAFALVPALALAVRTQQQNVLYRNPLALWEHNCAVTPLNRRSFYNLAHELRHAGRPEEARRAYARALELSPGYPEAHAGLSYVLYDTGDYTAALPHAEAALRLEPAVAEHYLTLAMVQARLGRQEAALATTRAGLAVDPASERLKKAAVVVFFIFDQPEKALEQLAYWSNAPRQSTAFLQAAIDLALSAGKPAVADALRAHLPASRDSVLDE